MAKEKKEFKRLKNILRTCVDSRPVRGRVVAFQRFSKPKVYCPGDRAVDPKLAVGEVLTCTADGSEVWLKYERQKGTWSSCWKASELTLIVPAGSALPH